MIMLRVQTGCKRCHLEAFVNRMWAVDSSSPPFRKDVMPRSAACGALAVAALIAIAGCTGPDSVTPSPSPTITDAAPQPTVTAEPSAEPTAEPEPDPVLVPEGSAEENAPFAQFVVAQRAAAQDDRLRSSELAQVLIDAGFAADAIEVTADRTPLGNATDVISFAILVGDACILGELRGAEAVTQTAPVLGTGRCLVGADVSIG